MDRPYKTGWAAIVVALVLLAPLAYLLSTGPAVWMLDRGWISDGAMIDIYAPLEWLADHSDLFRGILERYLDIWDGPDYAAPANAPLPAVPLPVAPPTTYTDPADLDIGI